MAVDKVFPLKIESTAGGTEIDQFPTALNPNEDYVACRGLALQSTSGTDESCLIERVVASTELKLTDAICGGLTLTDIAKDLNKFYFFDDFGGSAISTKWSQIKDGTGTIANIGEQGGVLQATTGGVANNSCSLTFGLSTNMWITTAMNFVWQARVRHDSAPTTNEYFYIGLYDPTNDHRVQFRKTNAYSGNLYTRTESGAVATDTNLGVAITEDAWTVYRIEASASQVLFYVNGSVVATHTTNIPSAALRPAFYFEETNTTPVQVSIDYMWLRADRT